MKSPKFFLSGARLYRGITIGAVATAAAISLAPKSAKAALQLTLSDGIPADTVTITDGGAGDDPTSGPGAIINTSNLNGFGVAITVTESNSPGVATSGRLQLTSLDLKNQTGAAGTLTIQASDTNYTLPAGPALTLTNSLGGTFTGLVTGDSASFQSFADPNNGQPASAVSTSPLSLSGATFSGTNAISWTRGAGAYSLSDTAKITLVNGDGANISGTTAATVPEPTTLGIGALLSLGFLSRRRRATA